MKLNKIGKKLKASDGFALVRIYYESKGSIIGIVACQSIDESICLTTGKKCLTISFIDKNGEGGQIKLKRIQSILTFINN